MYSKTKNERNFSVTFGIKNFALVFVQFISETSVQGERRKAKGATWATVVVFPECKMS